MWVVTVSCRLRSNLVHHGYVVFNFQRDHQGSYLFAFDIDDTEIEVVTAGLESKEPPRMDAITKDLRRRLGSEVLVHHFPRLAGITFLVIPGDSHKLV